MTLRLVTLMSVVLLLSLGAFGLLIDHSQDQMLDEVARTASRVGQATLRSFEFGYRSIDVAAPGLPPGATQPPHSMTWVVKDPAGALASPPAVGDVVAGSVDGTGTPMETIHRILLERRIDGADGPSIVACSGSISGGAEATEVPLDCSATGVGEAGTVGQDRMVVRVDAIEAESDPAGGGLVLKIPRQFAPDPATIDLASIAGGSASSALTAATTPAGDDRFEVLEVPIATGEIDELFSSMRHRSLALFLGVFVVGTALSAGLASRFTRPIRRLDAGLRRLSAGDLDVEVPSRGRDEIARLGAALNDVARTLRANRQRERELVRREKLSALGRLAAGVAHDVRNPLHSITLTLDHLHDAGRPESVERAAEFDRSVEIIRGEVRRLGRLVDHFLRFAGGDGRRRAPVDLKSLLTETASLVRKEAEWRRVEVDLRLADGVAPVLGDGEALRSSILNLVLNSFEAMPDGGRLELSLDDDGAAARIGVADTGHGIPEELRERVFEFAYTTRDDGSGLGLAMVHQCVVEDHGGRVELDGAPGGGTRVTLTIPAVPAPSGGAAA